MTRKSTRVKNIELMKRALASIDNAANLYDQAVEVYIPQFPDMEEGTKNIMELLSLTRQLMESSFDGM